MSKVISSTFDYIQSNIDTRRGSTLRLEGKSFMYDPGYGAYVEAWPMDGYFLTWLHLEGIVVAIHNALYLRGRFKTAFFNIRDEIMGAIGAGNLRKGNITVENTLTQNGSNITSDQ